MTTTYKVRRKYLFAWLPRAAMILTAALAPVIDGAREAHAAAAAEAEAIERLDAVVVTRVVTMSDAHGHQAGPR